MVRGWRTSAMLTAMSYHREHWKKWAGLVAEVVPGVREAVTLYDDVERTTRPAMPYRRGGHPVVAPVPWQYPGPPPDERRTAHTLWRLGALLPVPTDAPGAVDRMNEVDALLRAIPPAELDVVLARLGPAGRTALDALVLAVESDDGDWTFCRVQGFYNHLLESVGPYVVSLVGADMPGCQPSMDEVWPGGDEGWLIPAGPFTVFDQRSYRTDDGYRVEGSVAPMAWQDVLQGLVGDCWYLTSLQAVTRAEPGFLPRHIRRNPNGTVSVLLYHRADDDDGAPCPVTVAPDLPVRNGVLVGASGHVKDPAYAELWPAYHEKAFAQWSGGYHQIEGGYARDAFQYVTGRRVRHLDPTSPYLAVQADDLMRSGHAVAVGTRGGSDRDRLLDGRLVAGHEYFVKATDRAAGRICLGNPWGDAATRQEWECWLGMAETADVLDEAVAVHCLLR